MSKEAPLQRDYERERLIASHQAASDAFDRALLSLSAGSLALSIAFVSNLVDQPVSVGLLEASWISMGMAVLPTMMSFVLSVLVHHRLIATGDKGKSYEDLPRWSRLRKEMRSGNPIFETYVESNGDLVATNGFLNAERNLLSNHGWQYHSEIRAWLPPG